MNIIQDFVEESKEVDSKPIRRCCDLCGHTEHKLHPIRKYKIQLDRIIVNGKSTLACQVCKVQLQYHEQPRPLPIKKIGVFSMKLLMILIFIGFMYFIFSEPGNDLDFNFYQNH